MTREEAVRNRLLLYLTGERALGLRSLPVKPAPRPVRVAAASAAALPAFAIRPRPAAHLPPPAAPPAAVRPEAKPVAPPLPPPSTTVDSSAGEELPAGPALSRDEKLRILNELNEKHIRGCQACRLSTGRTNTVFGEGDPDAKIFFIGEGPGETEDLTGRPFVGRAGQLLEKMINGMGLKREQVFIGNIVKCRPPANRAPVEDEVAACTPYLIKQLETVRPQVIVTLGLPATKYMLKSNASMGRMRGQWHSWRGIKLMPTYHPAYVLRYYNQETRAAVWNDLQMVMAELGLKPPRRASRDSPGL